jgi:hypothetical protein
MSNKDELKLILDRIVDGQSTEADISRLRELSRSGDYLTKLQLDKFNINIGEGKDIHIGDRIYQSVDVKKIREILVEILQTQDRDLAPLSTKTRQQYLIEQRNRKILLDIVYSSWVDDSLKQSLYCDIQIKLGLEKRQDAVESTWGRLGSPRRVLPQGTRIIDQFRSLATGRLLILGQAGAGKTTALVELAKDLIEQAKENFELPIPVVFHLSTWKIPKQSLKEWLIAELSSKYDFKEVITVPWIESQQILLLLDGLDEVHSDWQEDCIKNINKFSQDYGQTQMVVCSRLDDYKKLSGQLRCDTALLIQPLNPEQIDLYLQNLQEVSGTNLQAIRSVVQTDPILTELAKTPLFLWIISLIYKGDTAVELPQEKNTEEEIKQHLFSQYIDRMAEPPDRGQRYPYPQTNKKRNKQDKSSRTYTKEETLVWLQFLAKRLNRESNSIFLIEQLNPNWLPSNVSPWLYRLGVGLAAGLIMEWFYGLPLGLMGGMLSYQMLSGLLAGVSLGLLSSMNPDIKFFDSFGWSWSRALKVGQHGLLSGPLISMIFSFMDLASIIPIGNFWYAIIYGLLAGVVIGVVSGCIAGFIEPKGEDTKVITPNRRVLQAFQKTTVVTLLATLVVLIAIIMPITLNSDYFVPVSVLLGCISLYIGGLACLQHLTIRTLLWQNHRAPWNYAPFLNYATNRLIIKQVGSGYLFIHELLRQNLVTKREQIKLQYSWRFYSQRIIVGVLGVLVGIIFLAGILFPLAINSWKVSSKTAEIFSPLIEKGDLVLTDKPFYRISRFKLGDIIIFRPEAEMLQMSKTPTPIMPEKSYAVGSTSKGLVIGCPGDSVIIRQDNKIIVNGKTLPDKYSDLKILQNLPEYSFGNMSRNTYLIITKKDHNTSIISKIPGSHIQERVILKIWSTFTSI